MARRLQSCLILAILLSASVAHAGDDERVRARDLGIAPGIFPAGKWNAITDVDGVRVGHLTRIEGDDIRTGVTAILPHGGNLYQDKVPAGVAVANAFGKLAGALQIRELGEIETPIVLTNTLSVPQAADAIIHWTLVQPGNEQVRSVNPVVGETNDGRLNDIRARVIDRENVLAAVANASSGPPDEGSVGAGTGTVAFGWKGGIGTSSRVLPEALGGYTVGVLVQSNFGGTLQIAGVPVGTELNQYYLRDHAERESADGSIMIIVATDAPISDRNLTRLARRTFSGLARTGSAFTNGSGDFAIAFSAAESVRRTSARRVAASAITDLPNDAMSPLLVAAADATEEAIYNSLFMAHTVTAKDGLDTVGRALDIGQVRTLLQRYRGK